MDGMRQQDGATVMLLKAVGQHRSIRLCEDVATDLDQVVGPYAEDVGIEGGVMDLAEREPIGHDRLTLHMGVGQDVRRI